MICSPFKKKNFGFTLIELLIVIAIIAILTTFGAASYSRIQKGSRDTQRKADLEKVRGALEQYYSDFNVYPPNLDTLTTTTPPSGSVTYLKSIPTNPTTSAQPTYNLTGGGTQSYCLGYPLETVPNSKSCVTTSGLGIVLTPQD